MPIHEGYGNKSKGMSYKKPAKAMKGKDYFTIIGVLECEKQITMANMNNPKGGDEDANT